MGFSARLFRRAGVQNGEFEMCPSWVPRLDEPMVSAEILWVNKGFVAVRAGGDLRRKSSKYVQCGEPQIVALKSKHFSSSSLRKSLKM